MEDGSRFALWRATIKELAMNGYRLTSAVLVALLAGCANVPKGPSVAVMPGSGKSFEQFVTDDRACREYADQSLGTDVNTAGANNVATGAVVGTAVGAAAGALIGGHHAAGGGAGVGLLAGSAIGAGEAGQVQYDAQRRYDIAYEQCMYAKGNQLPTVSTSGYYRYRLHPAYRSEQTPTTVIIHQPASMPPPPPPGLPPPPPPGSMMPPPPPTP
jgi:uncharacterized protein YcfJ